MIVPTSVAFVNVFPKLVDFARTIASLWLLVAKRRHVTWTAPESGSMAIAVPWLIELLSESLIGLLQVAPQSNERVNMIFVLVLPVNFAQVKYTVPAGNDCVGDTLIVHCPAPARGTSAATHGLSRNWPEVPVSTTFVPTDLMGSRPRRPEESRVGKGGGS